ncbi:serine hydrolase domain-containing protein [Micromonospora sp. NBC_01796]|uniref:serine hydrolase domain-containing protein n=1 Tax=Micromonospora sp. NBC_01796 TaxID=2975987 RepID=UPI002DD925D8|nr:serine hydrolase domain-containing protein [Micromonospora sp. NBC_01796]WSA89990.1 beta-lactamase family protein [Micromonospora sp. NBC_01796]
MLLGWLVGPRPVRLGPDTVGDVELAASVRATISDPDGYRTLSIALVEHGTVRFAGLGGGVEPATSFEIGSVTKALTGMLLADLVADGTVRTDELLKELLPDVALAAPTIANITLDALASHRAGLPAVWMTSSGQVSAAGPYAGQDVGRLLSSVGGTPVTDPGTVRYSNYGMALLGAALGARTGMSYPELLRQRILQPLGMAETRFHLDGEPIPEPHADGSTVSGRATAPWQGSGYAPAGVGAWSTAPDLAKLVNAILQGTAPGIAASTPRFDAGALAPGRRIGYGWFTDTTSSDPARDITWHNGGTGGFRSFVGFDRAAGRGVVVLGNTDRSVTELGKGLLVGRALPDRGPAGPGGLAIAVTVLLSLGGALVLLLATLRHPDRLKLVATGIWAVAGPVLAYPVGAWQVVPWLLWAVGAGLSAAALMLAALRWRWIRTYRGRWAWLGWLSTGLSVLTAASAVATFGIR